MALNKAPNAITARRRELVGQMLSRKMTRREIVETLTAADERNPATDEPWSLGTIQEDAKALERQWRATAQKDAKIWKARQLAEIEEVKRDAWSRGKLDFVLRAIELEAKITGTQAPVKLSGEDGKPLAWPVIILPENGRTLPMPQPPALIAVNDERRDADQD